MAAPKTRTTNPAALKQLRGPTDAEQGSAAQRDRRRRILDATLALASKGGYDAVQMRTVAEQADVALGTLYRYFPSKIHLLVSGAGPGVRADPGEAGPHAPSPARRRTSGRCSCSAGSPGPCSASRSSPRR